MITSEIKYFVKDNNRYKLFSQNLFGDEVKSSTIKFLYLKERLYHLSRIR